MLITGLIILLTTGQPTYGQSGRLYAGLHAQSSVARKPRASSIILLQKCNLHLHRPIVPLLRAPVNKK